MQQATIHDRLEISYPDSFRTMTADELRQAYGMDYADMWGIRDEENHIILAVIWKESSEMLQKLASSKSLAKRVDGKLRKALRKQGYRAGEHFERPIAGQSAPGFGYSYQAQGVAQACEAIVLREGNCTFTLYYYTRSELEQDNRPTYESMLSSLRFA